MEIQELNYFVHMKDPSMSSDLGTKIPHLFHLGAIRDKGLRRSAAILNASFNDHQRQALESLKNVPEKIFWMTGCPGAGKTHTALRIAALAQMSTRPVRVLYLADINKAVDDVTEFMAGLYETLGMKKTLVRMYGWPKEVRLAGNRQNEAARSAKARSTRKKSSKHVSLEEGRDNTPENPLSQGLAAAILERFKQAGLREQQVPSDQASIDQHPTLSEEAVNTVHLTGETMDTHGIPVNKYQTLDEAAWQHFRACPEKFEHLHGEIASIENTYANDQKDHKVNQEAFDKLLRPLYKACLENVDFVSTTPVSVAFDYFANSWQPDLVLFDEAAHAREASTLIPIGFCKEAQVYIYLGDPAQGKPWAFGGHDQTLVDHLRTSALERADTLGAVNARLLINRRALGGLERLSSHLFYDGKMIPDPAVEAAGLPDSTLRLRNLLKTWRGGDAELNVPRLLVSLSESKWAQAKGDKSSYNPVHGDYISKKVKELLSLDWFVGIDGKTPGSILILTPFRESAKRYLRMVASLRPRQASRVAVRTWETAAGTEADLVFVDVVKASGFSNNRNRLNVTLSRAVQGEVILLPKRFTEKADKEGTQPTTTWLNKVFQYCKLEGQIYEV